MDLSIIIPSYNTKDLLDRCLSSITNSLRFRPLTYEVIVVDNASSDGTKELLNKKYTRVIKIFNRENVGYGRANNQGIRKAKGSYILLLNSDIEVLNSGIERLVAFGMSRPTSFVGGKLFNEDTSPQPSCGQFYTLPVVLFMLFLKGDTFGITRSSPSTTKSVDWVSGSCMGGTKQSFTEVGLFDEHIFLYMEEIEFLYRAKKIGLSTYFYPDAHFIHSGAASSGNRKQPVINIYKGLLYFYSKHKSIIEQWALRMLLVLKAYLVITVGKLTRKDTLVAIYEQALDTVR